MVTTQHAEYAGGDTNGVIQANPADDGTGAGVDALGIRHRDEPRERIRLLNGQRLNGLDLRRLREPREYREDEQSCDCEIPDGLVHRSVPFARGL